MRLLCDDAHALDQHVTLRLTLRIATSRKSGETQKCNEENADLWNEFENVLKINDTRRLDQRACDDHHSEQRR